VYGGDLPAQESWLSGSKSVRAGQADAELAVICQGGGLIWETPHDHLTPKSSSAGARLVPAGLGWAGETSFPFRFFVWPLSARKRPRQLCKY